MKRQIFLVLLLVVCCLNTPRNQSLSIEAGKGNSKTAEDVWVDAKFDAMTEEEQIGQLLMIRAYSNKGPEHTASIEKHITTHHVGGLCFFQGTPERQAELTNRFQALSPKVPLMIAIDAEWGLGMRFKEDGFSFPKQLTLGAIQDNRLLYEMGQEIGRQCHRIGVHVNFAPVADVNNNPENPVINTRSFGEDRYNVAAKCYMYMKGLQDAHVMACAKHFPGHGDTDVDSHYDLPVISHAQQRLDSIELFPFKVLAEHNVQSMMVAHLHVPILDNRTNRPTTLSRATITNLLKKEMGFEGLIFTDGLGMKGVTKHHQPGEVEAEALVAGNDVLLLPEDVPAAVNTIKKYLAEGKLDRKQFEKSVKKVLTSKFQLGLTRFEPLKISNMRAELNSSKALVLKRRLIANALTLVRNKDELLPFRQIDKLKMASLSLGAIHKTDFQKTLSMYTGMEHYYTGKELSPDKIKRTVKKLSEMDVVIIGLHDMSSYARDNFGLSVSQRTLIEKLQEKTKVVLVVFGNPYSLKYFDKIDWVLQAYESNEHAQDLAAQALFGAFSIQGRLPVTASKRSRFGDGQTTNSLFRLGYAPPASVGLNAAKLEDIDDLVEEAIKIKATPGAVVLVAKDGKVVFHKAYGHHTYSRRIPVERNDIYDLASITKIAATTISTMKLYDQGRINIYQPLSDYLPELKATNKAGLSIYDIMAHRAGLRPWIPFFEQTVTKSKRNPRPSQKFYRKTAAGEFNTQVTNRLFMLDAFRDSIWQQIRQSELRANREYKYSDLGFYMLGDMVGRISGVPIERYAQEQFYQPLGLVTATYNPNKKFPNSRIVPSEEDKYFRRQRIQGYVHDMGAAMLGGVSGHAGLFSNANDLAVIMQMLLNDGYYGGKQYLSPETVRLFTTRHSSDTRRGIGFDMKELSARRNQNMSQLASASTFGHLGFTGTCTWADSENDIIFVFLSNRTYPSMHNNKLGARDYRPRIQEIVYEAMEY